MLHTAWESLRQRVSGTQLARFGLSLVIAIVLWGWVTQLQDPIETQQYAEVPIAAPDLPGAVELVTSLPRATVSITDVSSRLDDISRSDITLVLDTSSISGPGAYQLPVIAESTGNIREIRVSPDTVSVQVEEEISENFPLTIDNQLVADDARRIVDIAPEASQVTVTGTESVINRIQRVVLPVSVQDRTGDFVAMIEPYAVDEEGQRVQEVSILPRYVRTEVQLEKRGKAVSIVPQVSGSPAEGFVVQQQVALPATVIVDGPEEVLDELLFLNTEPVDISGAEESISETVPIQDLPEGVTLIDPSENEIEVRVSISASGGTANVIPDMPIQVANAADGMQVTTDPESLDIGVSATSETLTSLTPEDIQVTVDVAGLGPGVYTLEPGVTVPDDVNVTRLEPETVVVLISDQTATPVNSSDEGPSIVRKHE